jgi:hypothetical protein
MKQRKPFKEITECSVYKKLKEHVKVHIFDMKNLNFVRGFLTENP